MRIITFHGASNKDGTTGHLWNGGARTACGLTVADRAGPTNIDGDNLHLCGNCEKVIVSEGSTMWWRYAAA